MSSAREEVDHLTTLLHHPGWQALTEALAERTDAARREVLDGGLTHEKYLAACAEVSRSEWVMAWPAERIALLTARIEEGTA